MVKQYLNKGKLLRTFVSDLVHNEAHFYESKLLKGLVPAVHLSETATAYLIKVAAPGIGKDDIKVRTVNGIIYISASGRQKMFNRTLPLPLNADCNSVESDYKDDLLLLTMSKKS